MFDKESHNIHVIPNFEGEYYFSYRCLHVSMYLTYPYKAHIPAIQGIYSLKDAVLQV